MTSEASTTTRAVRTAIESDTQHGAVVPPLHLILVLFADVHSP